MREVARLLPNENLIYLGDTARVPYGTRSPQTIVKYTLENASFLLEKKIKMLIVACHTACSHALKELQRSCPVPVIGVMDSGFKNLMSATQAGRIAILGTPSTIGSGLYQTMIREHSPSYEVFAVPCPLFVPLIEEGLIDHPATQSIVHYYLDPLREKKIDAALLACTHYPLIRNAIAQTLGPAVSLIEPAESTALAAKQFLTENNLLNRQMKSHFQFYATDDPQKFTRLATIFFGSKIQNAQSANLF